MFKKHLHLLTLLLTILISGVSCLAQEPITQRFKYLTTNNGLGDNTIWTILQDNYGFMWFGTMDGLYKLEGNKIKAIQKNFFKEKGYGNAIYTITEDKKNNRLWIYVKECIFTLDLETEKITHEKALDNKNIYNIYADENGLLWLAIRGEQKGIYTYDYSTMKLEKWNKAGQLNNYNIREIRQDKEGLYYFLIEQKGVSVYNPQLNKFYNYFDQIHGTTTSLKDSAGNIWIGTWHGLYKWDKKTNKYQKLALQKDTDNQIFAITTIIEHLGYIYITTDSGLYIYNPKNNSFRHLKSDYLPNGTLNNNYLNTIFFDRENTLWIGTYFGGINYMPENSQNFSQYDFVNSQMGGHVISAFSEDDNGNLWIGTEDGGVSFWDKKTNQIVNYNPHESKNTFLNFFNVHALLIDGDLLYCGMSNIGLNIYNTKTKKCQKFPNKEKGQYLSGNSIYSFLKIDQDNLAIGTISGLDLYNIPKQEITPVREIPKKTVHHMIKDKDNGIWICGNNLGIFYKGANEEWTDFCKNNKFIPTDIIYTLATRDKYIYIGTQDYGVIIYDFLHNKYQSILTKELENNIVFDIIPENSYLWISTSNGLYQYDLDNQKVRHFTEDNELKSRQLNINAGILTQDSTIFIGTVNGLNGFKSKNLIFNEIAPTTALTSIRVNSETLIPMEKGSPLKKILPYTKSIELDYDQSNISIDFTTLSHTGKKGTTYKYKLKPDQKDWIYTNSNTVNFNKLPTGTYTLLVKSCNDCGVWDTEGTELEITILPPWWLTWYMKTIYVLLILTGIGALILHYKHKQEQKIKEIDVQKSEEIYQSKMEFFTNVIHDIRTPLTLITAPLHSLINRKDTLPFRFELDIIQRNSERLLNQVNQLMDFRKAEQVSSDLSELSPIDILAEIENLYKEFYFSARAKGIQINIKKKDHQGPIMVNGNKEIINKIFSNLLSNALKFTSSKINVIIEQKEKECTITIQDDGIGIPDEMKEHIFKPFYQIKESLPKDYIGTGIGLSIVTNLVKKMEGKLELDSQPNIGSSFAITFPVITSSYLPELSQEQAQVEIKDDTFNENHPGSDNAKKSIALIEDNDDMRVFIASLLKNEFTVTDYPSGNAFLEETGNKNFDIIISDIMMPGIDGYELCKKVKEDTQTSHIPVILLTAKVQDQDEIEGLNIGADAYIKKPFSPEVLIARIKNLIKSREKLLAAYRNEPETKLTDFIDNQKDAEFINKMNDIINENLTNPELSVSFMAQQMCVSRSLFFMKIKAVSGMTFVDYVRIARLKRAVDLMRNESHSINEIADMVGFSTPSYFCRCFKQQFNIPPSEYLKKLRGQA